MHTGGAIRLCDWNSPELRVRGKNLYKLSDGDDVIANLSLPLILRPSTAFKINSAKQFLSVKVSVVNHWFGSFLPLPAHLHGSAYLSVGILSELGRKLQTKRALEEA
jgi:hypothetical protein